MPGKYQVTPRGRGTSPRQQAEWRQRHGQPIDLESQQGTILAIVEAIREAESFNPDIYDRIVRHLAREGHPILPKAVIRRGYLALIEAGIAPRNDLVLQRLQMKPTRTQSGVAPVTVLTKPYPCPGACVFCPDDVRMPKSYLSNEPGAMRALMLDFDPYVQTAERIKALRRIGHTVDKIELLILGGTWSCYPRDYQEWFVRRCFDAMNTTESPDLIEAYRLNENAPHRNVGLVIETRPDHISADEVVWLRQLGVTRVQLGVQSLDDHLLELNKRGHTAEESRRAIRLLRSSGFKIAVHWMPNLLGATPESDLADFETLWADPALRPDEIKIYPTGLIRGTELYDHYERGEYHPYDEETLIDLLAACKKLVPPYCRINRLMRDIPAPEIAEGVTTSNLRQIVQQRLRAEGSPCRCIRCREVRREPVDAEAVRIDQIEYQTDHSRELFLQALTGQDRLAGFLRLSLPISPAPIAEFDGQAIIRQVQVYGPVVGIDAESGQQAQHRGLGTRLIEEACVMAGNNGFTRIAVIAAVGTREYYRRLGFDLGDLYMSKEL
ncbi:MAG: tRNA uridine(34) 5-carboxymethylaminomethyl modification radical SAM/GNAT enzyme Elp3 [Anaerolineae bacterium]|nr:tRNA uridine(34) 5-carboxymethylaminomethyl modification radical SAM/GNAT enzyme Elp3 [Anaerolineae bacterium]